MHFVWLHIHAADDSVELKYSIRSVYKYFQGDVKVTLIGDRPNWYRGHHIPVTQIFRRANRKLDSTVDQANKMIVAATHPEISEEFLWCMDDFILLKPVTVADLRVVRYDPWWQKNNKSQWHKLISTTFDALKAKGRPNYQTGTHLPHMFEKHKLVELFSIYNYPKALTLFEILYTNHYAKEFIPYGSVWEGVEYPYFIRRMLTRPVKAADIDAVASGVFSFNWQANAYCNILRDWLESNFASASEVE